MARPAMDNIPGPPGGSWITGHLTSLFSPTAWDFHRNLAEKFGSVSRIRGPFGSNHLYVFDPRAIYHLLVKDHHIYDETQVFVGMNKIMFGEGIFTSMGDTHRRQRKMFNPVFSNAHMREMSLIFFEVVHKVQRAFSQKVKNGPVEIDLMRWMTRLSLELIGQSGLGYSFDDLTEGTTPHRYGEVSKLLTPKHMKYFAHVFSIEPLIPYLIKISSFKFTRLIVDWIPSAEVKEVQNILHVLQETSVEIFESKKAAIAPGDEVLSAQIERGKDIMSILLAANMQADENDRLSEEELVGQVTSLTFAATDTTSGALCRIFHLLSMHKNVQAQLREEIRQARKVNGEDIDFDTLLSLPLLDAVCRETLRLHPPVSTLQRVSYSDAILPLSTPVKGINGEYISEIPIPRGTICHISILNSNTNPELWGPDAHEWKPERWMKPLPRPLIEARIPGIYSHLLTFFGGGRSCIGFKFSQLEMKVVVALLLEKFEFSEMSDKSIYWQMTNISSPHLNRNSSNPTLPLMVSMAQ